MTEGEQALLALKEARGRIVQGWIQGLSAIDEHGGRVEASSLEAVAWCMSGSLFAPTTTNFGYSKAGHWLEKAIGNRILHTWNDQPGRTKEEVLAAFDKAIDSLSKRVGPRKKKA